MMKLPVGAFLVISSRNQLRKQNRTKFGNGCLFEIQRTGETPPLTHLHVAFRAKSKAEVDAFHRAAVAAGATDNGAPGPRPDYAEHYYACFVLDPDGYNIEAMINEAAKA